MVSLWNDQEAEKFKNNDLEMRVYTSRILGANSDLVLHGGGNTSVKVSEKNLFGEEEDLLYVKGSGWDLATIEAAGFAPVKMQTLLKMADLKELSDVDMVTNQRAAMTNPSAPNPSVEAILHAIIPFKFVDHTHTDAVVTVTNTEGGEAKIKEIYADTVLVIPYVMPGFILARTIYGMTKGIDWSKYEGMVLLNHGLFTFNDDAKKSYEKMIELVTKAENYIDKNMTTAQAKADHLGEDLLSLAKIRKAISAAKGSAVIVNYDQGNEAVNFSSLSNVEDVATQGPLTPDHVIRNKRVPMVFERDYNAALENYQNEYKKYFNELNSGETMLNPAPKWAIWKNRGILTFGGSAKEAGIISDIKDHSIKAFSQAMRLGGYKALSAKDIFEVEYWSLEQAKLKKSGSSLPLQGQVAIVTGAASGIGRATLDKLHADGAAVVGLDINPIMADASNGKDRLGLVCDLTKDSDIQAAIETTVRTFGGLDIIVSNAGIFTASEQVDEISNDLWQRSMDINLTGHQKFLKFATPFLKEGVKPSIVIMASKNVPAPGKGAAAYSVAKAGLTQLARIAALELGEFGINVNMLHPHAVFDTGIWTPEVLEKRAKHYGMSVEEYKTNNILKTEISSKDVANLVAAMAGELFSKTTGAQLPIDGGSDRII